MSGRRFTDEEVKRILEWVMTTECGYCLDGADAEALPCPECGMAAKGTDDERRDQK